MSLTELYAINGDGDVVHYTDFRNAWHGAMHVWDALWTVVG